MAPVLHDEKPEPGDLIEIFRVPYQHWAIYVGDGFVVHLTSASEGSGVQSSGMSVQGELAVVKTENLSKVVGTDKWIINNGLDKKYEPRQSHIIVKEARALVGQHRQYCVLRENCEHFANELRYGKAESRQACMAEEALGVGLTAAAVAAAAVVVAAVVKACK